MFVEEIRWFDGRVTVESVECIFPFHAFRLHALKLRDMHSLSC